MAKMSDVLKDFTPEKKTPNNLKDLYDLEDDPDSELHRELQALYDENKVFMPAGRK